jgi:preprotein translocase subunit SecF
MHLYLYNKEEDNMIKNKGLMVMFLIIVIVVTFFVGSAFAERVTRDNTEKGCVFIGGSVTEISVSESVVEKNRILLGSERKKRKSIEKIYRESAERQKIIQEDYMRMMQERERIQKEEEEQERIKEQEKEEEQEREKEQERIKKEDWFR